MRVTKFLCMAVILVTCSICAAAQENPSNTAAASIKHVAISNTPANSGKEMFNSYCAVCHGKDGKGDGPAASALKAAPPDLTILAQKNGGKYPATHVAAVIRGKNATASHGSADMPIWGPLFSSISHGHEAQVEQRVSNLVAYLDSQQVK